MSKPIMCHCEQGYHYSPRQRARCMKKNKFIVSATIQDHRQLLSIGVKPHHQTCKCDQCEEIRIQSLVFFFKPEPKRMKLRSQSEISSDQLSQVEISKFDQQNLSKPSHKKGIWHEKRITELMELGIGDINSRYFEAVKSHRQRMRKNHTFLRMYLFLNPQTSIIVTQWSNIVQPKQLMLQEARTIDIRSYRQRIEDRLGTLAKKYKQFHMNSKGAYFKSIQMIEIQNKIDHLTKIVEKFDFIEQYEDSIADKQQQLWEKSIVFLKKGESKPGMVQKFSDLKVIAPFFQPPARKKTNLHLITKKQHLDRRYRQVNRQAKYYGLFQRQSWDKEFQLLQRISCKQSADKVKKMDIEQPNKSRKIVKLAQDMDIEHQIIIFNENNDAETRFLFQQKKIKQCYGRSYLFPRVCIKGVNAPLTMKQISNSIARIMSGFNEKWSESKMQTEETRSKADWIHVFSQEKSIAESNWHPQPTLMIGPKPIQRQFIPKSCIELYSLSEIHNFPILKGKKHFQCFDFQRCSRMGCQMWLKGSILECIACNAVYHDQCWPYNNFCHVCQSTRTNVQFKFDFYRFNANNGFRQMNKMLTPPPAPLFPEEIADVIKQIQQNLSGQKYCVINCFDDHFTIFPFYNSRLRLLHVADQDIIDAYESQKIAFPVGVKEINSIKGKGLIARRPIEKGELVATYSGNVLSLAQVAKDSDKNLKDYIFHLISGPDVSTNFVVFPKAFASVGFFMNHADQRTNKKKINVKTCIALHRNGPIVLMLASKKIKYGEELLYDYNGEYDAYNTEGFE